MLTVDSSSNGLSLRGPNSVLMSQMSPLEQLYSAAGSSTADASSQLMYRDYAAAAAAMYASQQQQQAQQQQAQQQQQQAQHQAQQQAHQAQQHAQSGHFGIPSHAHHSQAQPVQSHHLQPAHQKHHQHAHHHLLGHGGAPGGLNLAGQAPPPPAHHSASNAAAVAASVASEAFVAYALQQAANNGPLPAHIQQPQLAFGQGGYGQGGYVGAIQGNKPQYGNLYPFFE